MSDPFIVSSLRPAPAADRTILPKGRIPDPPTSFPTDPVDHYCKVSEKRDEKPFLEKSRDEKSGEKHVEKGPEKGHEKHHCEKLHSHEKRGSEKSLEKDWEKDGIEKGKEKREYDEKRVFEKNEWEKQGEKHVEKDFEIEPQRRGRGVPSGRFFA